jgi:hypothetical protein
MTLVLRKALDENGFKDVKIHMHNASRLYRGIDAAVAFTERKDVWNKIDYAASNMYDFQAYFRNVDAFDERIEKWNELIKDKPFLSTEMCINRSHLQVGSYRVAFTMGQLYHKNMAMLNAQALIYCWGILNGPHESFDATRSLFKVDYHQNRMPAPSSFQLRVFGSFSRRLKRDMVRINAESSHKDLLVTAYVKDDSKTLVLLNRSASPIRFSLDGLMENYKWLEKTSQFAENLNVEIKHHANGNEVLIYGGEILTFYN